MEKINEEVVQCPLCSKTDCYHESRTAMLDVYFKMAVRQIKREQAECLKYREALEKIAADECINECSWSCNCSNRIARAALKTTKEG